MIVPPAPEHLTGHAALAWGAMARTLAAVRPITAADELSIEAAAKAWGRWRSLEDKLAELGAGNPLAGEVTKGKDGNLQVSALRQAASAAFDEYNALAQGLGVDERADLTSIDLFGYPDRPGRGQKGRPRFVVTQRDRNRVRLLLAMGWSNPRIAAALEVSLPTLHKYFRRELAERDVMRDRLDARRLELAMEQANGGNISALRELGKLIDRQDLMIRTAESRGDVEKPERRAAPIGKKEQRLAAAEAAASGDPDGWGDLVVPGLPGVH